MLIAQKHQRPRLRGRYSVEKMAGVTGLEPAASGVTGQRSNQLSYTPSAALRDDTVYWFPRQVSSRMTGPYPPAEGANTTWESGSSFKQVSKS